MLCHQDRCGLARPVGHILSLGTLSAGAEIKQCKRSTRLAPYQPSTWCPAGTIEDSAIELLVGAVGVARSAGQQTRIVRETSSTHFDSEWTRSFKAPL